MKKKHMVYAMLGAYALYSICTPFGAMKLQALIISRNPAVYFNRIEPSVLGEPYYTFQNDVRDYDTGNTLGDFTYRRTFLLVTAEYVGFS